MGIVPEKLTVVRSITYDEKLEQKSPWQRRRRRMFDPKYSLVTLDSRQYVSRFTHELPL